MEALILVAENGGPTMLPRIGVMRALNRHRVREFNPDRKEKHWASGSLSEINGRNLKINLAPGPAKAAASKVD
jgi:hypothetical protein